MNIHNKEIKSPCFIVDKEVLDTNISIIKESFKKIKNNLIIGYSVKTNSSQYLINYFNTIGIYSEVVSADEYNYVKRLGISLNKIIYNGPIKSKATLIEAVSNDSIVNIDSFRELMWLIESNIYNKEIGIRVNLPIIDDLKHHFEYPKDGSRFGFDINDEKLSMYINSLLNEKNIKIVGLHFHINTNNRDPIVYSKMIEYSQQVIKKFNLKLKYIDIGGGYFGGNKEIFETYIKEIKRTLLKHSNLNNVNLIIEPGAALVATAISYYTKVIDTKIINDKKIITVDGSRVHIDPTFSDKKYKYYVKNNKTNKNYKTIICGFSCMERDRFKLDKNLDLSTGDYIIFKNLGAYTMTFIPNFIFGNPRVYVKENNKLRLISKKRSLER